jgi:hypothetical protein
VLAEDDVGLGIGEVLQMGSTARLARG